MASPGGPTIPIEYSNIINSGSSRNHLGNNYTSNIYYNSRPVSTDDDAKAQALIESLRYSEIRQRENQIHDADEFEYDWAFEASSTALENWLKTASGIFWVAGKAGSGKSTFMKFLREHAKTERLLEQWSASRELIIAAHYFWYSGTQSLQRNREGLYRSLLYQALTSRPTALPSVLAERWESVRKGLRNQADWTTKELLHGCSNLFALPDTAFVIFVDGLDECDPSSEHSILITELEKFAKCGNVKICVSSRPWKPFEPRFRNSKARLNLQDLTRPDIERYITKELANSERDAGLDIGLREDDLRESMDNLSINLPRRIDIAQGNTNMISRSEGHWPGSNDSGNIEDHNFDGQNFTRDGKILVHHIAMRSEGVFLWVYLILKDLRDEIFAGRQIRELEEFVHKTPSDLMKYYKMSIWRRIGWRRERQVAMALKIVIVLASAHRQFKLHESSNVDGFLYFLHFWHLQTANGLEDPWFGTLAPIVELSDRDFLQMLSTTSAFLGEVCKDLIRVENHVNKEHVPLLRIEFLHRSVLDYLTEPETLAWIDERIPNHFKESRFFFELNLARMKLVPAGLAQSVDLRSVVLQSVNDVLTIITQMVVLPLGNSTNVDIKHEFGGVDAELVRQYEGILIHYIRLCYKDDCLPGRLSFGFEKCATRLLTLGCTGFLSEACWRQPSLNFGYVNQNSFLQILPQLFTHKNEQNVYHAVKVMFDLGYHCGVIPWHHFLYLWWQFTRAGKQNEQFLVELGKSVWRIAKLLLLDGVDTSTLLCLAHPQDQGICRFREIHFETPCSLRTPATALSEVVPKTFTAEFSSLLPQYATEQPNTRVRAYRKKKRVVWYRKGLEKKLQQSFERRSAESAYAAWVYRNEAKLEAEYKLFRWCTASQMLESAICQCCGVDILEDGCFRWVCLSCLAHDYCTLCLPLVRSAHMGQYQCMEANIGRFQIGIRERQILRGRDSTTSRVEGAHLPSTEICAALESAISEWHDAFESGIRNHESTKNMSREEAVMLVSSIILDSICLERDCSYLSEDPKGCVEFQLDGEKNDSSTASIELVQQSGRQPHQASVDEKQHPPKGELPSENEPAAYRLVVDI